MTERALHVLGFDPGKVAGVCCLAYRDPTHLTIRFLEVIEEPTALSRYSALCRAVDRAISPTAPVLDGAGVEIPFVAHGHGNAIISQGRSLGLIDAALARHAIIAREFNTVQVKKALTGSGNAGVRKIPGEKADARRKRMKESMIFYAKLATGWGTSLAQIDLKFGYLEACADAVAVAVATAQALQGRVRSGY